jgi:ABC-type branched-subunit amino acid transport system substrate-binding protein
MRRWLVVFTVLALLLPVLLTACGGSGDDDAQTQMPTSTATPLAISTSTPIVTTNVNQTPSPATISSSPVKIGAIQAWSGSMAMSGMLADQIIDLVQDQVKASGGILGGREVEFIKGDDQGVVAQSVAQTTRLILDEKIAILTLGGESAAQFTAVANIVETLKVPFVAMSVVYGLASMKYSACLYGSEAVDSRIANFTIEVLKPKTIAWLAEDTEDSHDVVNGVEGTVGVRERLKSKGIDIVYEQYYPQGTVDFSLYLTKIKYLKPDLFISYLHSAGDAITINKQITEQGGFGSMKYYCATEPGSTLSAIKIPSALGTYAAVLWLPGSDDAGMKAFAEAFVHKYGRQPDPNLTYYYNCFWTAIKAIELAGTDDADKVAQALRSGDLEWDSAWGPLHIPSDGTGQVNMMVAQVQEGSKLVKVWP